MAVIEVPLIFSGKMARYEVDLEEIDNLTQLRRVQERHTDDAHFDPKKAVEVVSCISCIEISKRAYEISRARPVPKSLRTTG